MAGTDDAGLSLFDACAMAVGGMVGGKIFAVLGTAAGQAGNAAFLASVARPVLGRAGLVAVLAAAVLSTASAINATLFASSRLARRVADDGELPKVVTRWTRGGVPIVFLAVMAAGAAAVELAGSLERITIFSSLVFLLVFAVVNASALAHRTWSGWARLLPSLGLVGCLSAAVVLTAHTWRTDRASLWLVGGITAAVGIGRLA